MTRARSLSLLANSNIFTVDQSNSRVGIGSTIPDVKLDVDGNMNVSGTLTYEDVTNVETAGITTTGGLVVTGLGATIGGITTFFGDINFGAAGVGGTVTTLGHAEFVGVVTASSFSGDGSGLTGVASTDNINTSTLAQFTGGVGIADSIFHIGDDNTAIRFPAADTFTIETGGTEAFRVASDQKVYFGDFASAGSKAYIEKEVSGDYKLNIYASSSTSQNRIITFNSREDVEALRIDASANVGIGSTIPQSKLDVGGDVKIVENSPRLEFHDANSGSLSNVTGGFETFDRSGNRATYVGAGMENGGNIIEFGTNNTFRAIIDSSGNVGINTNNPTTTLEVRGDVTIYNSNNQGDIFFGEHGDVSDSKALIRMDQVSSTAGHLQFHTEGSGTLSERFRIASSGQIGLGGANYGTAGQVITSNGSGSAPTWQDASGGISTQAGTASGIVTSLFLNDATDHKVTATGICTITTTQSGTEGQSHTIRIVNSGIATVGFSTYFLFPSGAAPVLPIADGAVSIISFTVHDSVGAGCTQLLAGASLNFS